MEQELIPYLDERFRETLRQITELRGETARRFDQVDKRFDQVDKRFEQVDRRFEQVDKRFEQVDRRFEQVDKRFEQVDKRFEAVEDTARHTLVQLEGVRHEVHLIAEGFLGLDDRLKRVQAAIPQFEQVIKWINPHYGDLDNRVRALEEQADHRYGDVLEEVRKRLIKPPLTPPVSE